MHYWNEFDPYAAQWIRNLIAAKLLPPGDVDERSIVDVAPDDLWPYTQCHFFAGIAEWSLALRLAGWPDDREVWTGSCPCQPFSAAGEGKAFDDPRHLWPHFYRLIRECRPAAVFGEQVASKAVDAWIDLVLADLEGVGYAGGAIAFPSASVGAPHIRDRTYWLGYAGGARGQARVPEPSQREERVAGVVDDGSSRRVGPGQRPTGEGVGGVADAPRLGLVEAWTRVTKAGRDGPARNSGDNRPGETNGFWRGADWLACRDGKWRPVEPGTFPLAHGLHSRVGRLRAYGNAINPYQAAAFIEAAEACRP
jgi:DNA (cytosine-5)-methyltransferase 1